MSSRKNPAANWMLYCILDGEMVKQEKLVNTARFLFKSGSGAVQLRCKNAPSYKVLRAAKKIRALAKKYGKTLLINDRPDVALASGADGVHRGAADMTVKAMRRLLGPSSVVGETVHSLTRARAASGKKIDYVGAGPVFATPFKRGLRPKGINFVRQVKKLVSVPVFAIGGIKLRNARNVLRSGADGVCVTRAAKDAKEIIKLIS